MIKENNYAHFTEDENIQNRFTAYIVTAVGHTKANYLIKQSWRAKATISLEMMMETQHAAPALAVSFDEVLVENSTFVEDMIVNDALLSGICKLNDKERRILNLRIIHKAKHKEVASLLGINKKTAEKAYERLLKKLRVHMEDAVYGRF